MKNIYFTVGPSQLYTTVPTYIANALENDIFSVSHTGIFFTELYKKLSLNLRELFHIPPTHHIFFTGSSTESMESIIENTVEKSSHHLITGGFSKKFFKIASDLQKNPQTIDLPWEKEFDMNTITIPHNAELLCITENDTSIGLQIPLERFKEIKKDNPSLLIAVDIVSSMPSVAIDYSYIDIAFFSVQKGFGLPAGLGILIVNDAAIEKAQSLLHKGISIGSHRSFLSLHEKEKIYKTPETPNVFNIFLLEKVTSDLLAIGIETIRQETEVKANLLYSYFDKHPIYKPLINGSFRSKTTIAIDVKGDSENIVNELNKRGYILSKGYRPYEKDHLRIANFPAHTVKDVENLLKTIDSIL
jgi:phosphoserine aminotransferase